MLPAKPKLRIPALAIDNHPDMVVNASIHLNAARYALKTVGDAWGKLREAEAVATDKKRLARAAQGVVNLAGKVVTESLTHMDESRKILETKLTNEITPARVDPVAVEIRAHFKAQKRPFMAVASLVKQNDRRTLAAVLSAPAYLSGLDDTQHATLRDMCRSEWYAEDVEALKDMERHGLRLVALLGTVKTTLEPLVKQWANEAEDAAFAKLNGGAA